MNNLYAPGFKKLSTRDAPLPWAPVDRSCSACGAPGRALVVELDAVGLSLGSRGASDQGPSGGRLGRSGRLFGVELDDPPRRTPLQCISARIWSVPCEPRRGRPRQHRQGFRPSRRRGWHP